MLKEANNRDSIALAMTLILFLGGVGLLALGVTTNNNDTFLAYLEDLVDRISGGNIKLEDFETEMPKEVNVHSLQQLN